VTDQPPVYQPVERRKVYELIADEILQQISSHRLSPGDPIPRERELTESFKVGRSSIREAMRMLESQGVIAPGPGGAFVVADVSSPLNSSFKLLSALNGESGIRDLYELRLILDCEAAALAAERHTQADVQAMDDAVDDMERALGEGGGPEQFIDADLRFHLAVAGATGNRLIVYSMQAIRTVVREALMTVYRVQRSPEKAVGEHRVIRAAIVARDPRLARQEMRAHLTRVESDVERASRTVG
jgi:GntR family transcriptional regulator, transcriptional repressor for pyruvate dehydrogenase complex